ncbi:hypothetical protein Dimus_009622 [Dionaea muscipula]
MSTMKGFGSALHEKFEGSGIEGLLTGSLSELAMEGVCLLYISRLGFPFGTDSPTSLAAAVQSKPSRTSKWARAANDWVVLLCVWRRSRSSNIWRLCRVSEGLSVDYG